MNNSGTWMRCLCEMNCDETLGSINLAFCLSSPSKAREFSVWTAPCDGERKIFFHAHLRAAQIRSVLSCSPHLKSTVDRGVLLRQTFFVALIIMYEIHISDSCTV